MSERFLYSVHPKRVIKNVPGANAIRTPKSLYLTKEDVRICLKGGSVYRRFANEARNEKVTISNVDRLHNAKFMTEEEYKKFLESEIDSKRGTVINDEKDESKVEEVKTVDKSEEKVEEPKIDEVPVETLEIINDEKAESKVEEVETTETVDKSEEKVEEPKNHNNEKNYGGKNKHRH